MKHFQTLKQLSKVQNSNKVLEHINYLQMVKSEMKKKKNFIHFEIEIIIIHYFWSS